MATIEDTLKIALAAIARGDIASATEAYRQLIRDFPDNKKAVWQAANGLRACNQSQEACAVLETGLAKNPEMLSFFQKN